MNGGNIVSYIKNFGNKKPLYVEKLKKMGFSNNAILSLVSFLTPAISQHVIEKFGEVFTLKDLNAIETVVYEREFSDEQRARMYEVAYEKKTGKKLESLTEEFMDEFVDDTEETLKTLDSLIKKGEDQNQNDFKPLFEEYISNFVMKN